MTRRRGRALGPDELRLWSEVARSVLPLSGRKLPEPPAEPAAVPAAGADAEPPAARVAPAAPKKSPALSPLAPIERRVARALSRGQRAPDAILDLHGLTQADAHRRLDAFLRRAQADGLGLVMVVTGQGRTGQGRTGEGRTGGWGEERGVLRRAVPHWLSLPELRTVVLGFDEAGPRQGGAGALVVRLRRRRS